MKKMQSTILLLLLVFSMFPAVLAQEVATTDAVNNLETTGNVNSDVVTEEVVDETTQEEVKAMNNKHGAEMRLLQLERAITRNLLKGQQIVEKVKQEGFDAIELELLLAELETLKEEVQNTDFTSENAVQTFVDLKKDAIELSNQFKNKARELLKDKSEKVREELKKFNEEQVKGVSERIKEKKKQYNQLKLNDVLDKLGVENKEELLEQAKTEGVKELRELIKTKMQELTPEEKKEAFSEIKKEGVKIAVAVRAKVEKFKEQAIERKEQRINERFRIMEAHIKGKAVEKLDELKAKRVESLKHAKIVRANVQERLNLLKEKFPEGIPAEAREKVQVMKAKSQEMIAKAGELKAQGQELREKVQEQKQDLIRERQATVQELKNTAQERMQTGQEVKERVQARNEQRKEFKEEQIREKPMSPSVANRKPSALTTQSR